MNERMNPMPSLPARLAAARQRRRRTWVERVLHALGLVLALLALAVVWRSAGAAEASKTNEATEASCRVPAPPAAAKRVLLVATDLTGLRAAQTQALQESVSSYFGVNVQTMALRHYQRGGLAPHDLLIVHGNAAPPGADAPARAALAALLDDAAQRRLPIGWVGAGAEALAAQHGLVAEPVASAPAGATGVQAAPAGSYLEYNGARIATVGMLTGTPLRPAAGSGLTVRGQIALPDGRRQPLVIGGPGLVVVNLVPFRDLMPNLALPATIDALSALLGRHRADPRVLLRLEDVNGREYHRGDRSFGDTTRLLLAENVFLHLSLVPQMVDADGKPQADIGDARSALKLMRRYPQRVEPIQHGGLHFRKSPRNFGLSSGTAYEFFFDDDETLGPAAAAALARERLTAGAKLLARHGVKARVFEAPHYTMSPHQEAVAAEMFELLHHAPLQHAGVRSYLTLAWPTRRGAASYAPAMVGFISQDEPRSVDNILQLLDPLARVLPDPVVVIQYHPFMTRMKGREGDLGRLVRGIKALGYRFASSCVELPRPPASMLAAPARAP